MTLTDYLKRGQFNATVQVLLYPYIGVDTGLLVWDDPIDVTDYVLDISRDVSDGVLDTSGSSTGNLIDKIELEFDNKLGFFNYNGVFFDSNIVNNSKIKITSSYETFERDSLGVLVPTTISSYVFNGIIKSDSSSWEVSRRVFKAGILGSANIFNCEKAYDAGAPGTDLATKITTLLNGTEDGSGSNPATIQSVMTIGSVTFGITGTYSNPATINGSSWSGVKILELLNKICFIMNSIWKISPTNTFLIEPINNTGSSVWDLTLDDIISIDDMGVYPLQFTALTWDDGVNTPEQQQMTAADRADYGYDLFTHNVDISFIALVARATILGQVFDQNKHKHRMITLTTKCNPELETNEIITIDHPAQAGINNFVIDPSIKWRVLTIRRKINLAPDMQIIAVQAGTGPDANLDGT
jgi:hypothetical protein